MTQDDNQDFGLLTLAAFAGLPMQILYRRLVYKLDAHRFGHDEKAYVGYLCGQTVMTKVASVDGEREEVDFDEIDADAEKAVNRLKKKLIRHKIIPAV